MSGSAVAACDATKHHWRVVHVFRCVGDAINHAIAKELPGDRAGPRILIMLDLL